MSTVSAATVAQGEAERLRDENLSNNSYADRLQHRIVKLNLEGRTVEAAALAPYLTAARNGTGNAGARGIA